MFWTKSPGTGGRVESEEDFIVEEIPSRKYFIRFRRDGSGVLPVGGPYTLALLTKKGMTTKEALEFLKKELWCEGRTTPKASVSFEYAGLKDKFAITSQYVTVRGNVREIAKDNIQLKIIKKTDKMMQAGDLEGNRFMIVLRGCRAPNSVSAFVEELASRGLPNYFGPQRFGRRGDNHLVGKLILKEQEAALKLINERNDRNFRHLGEIGKKTLKFYIHAYQSYLFNKLLDSYVSLNTKPFFGTFPIVGYGTKLGNDFAGKMMKKILNEEHVMPEDFSVRELSIKCIGSSRDAFVRPANMQYTVEGKTLNLRFTLPKGSYATVLIREVSKIKEPQG